jgi:transcription antitermination protein NusB
MSRRTRVRQVVLQLLYQDELNPIGEIPWRQFLKNRLSGKMDLMEFGEKLFIGVRDNRRQIDDLVSAASNNWKLARMAAIDRNVIRLAVFEFLHFGTPGPVAINEAIELARRYGDNDSPQFVNGILDRVYRAQLSPTPNEQ